MSSKGIITDATVGASMGVLSKVGGSIVENGLNKASNATKGKVGETASKVKYAIKGYKSEGKAIVRTGKSTPKGRTQAAYYDHDMKNIFTGKHIIVESKFNTSGLTRNQRAAKKNVTVPFYLDRTTGKQVGNMIYQWGSGSSGVISNSSNKKR